jgi:hypothetical protein
LGSTFIYGNISGYIASYFREIIGDRTVDERKAYFGFPIIVLTSTIVMPIAAKYVNVFAPKMYHYLI